MQQKIYPTYLSENLPFFHTPPTIYALFVFLNTLHRLFQILYIFFSILEFNINVIGFLNKPVTYDMAERVLNKAKRNKEELNILFEYVDKSHNLSLSSLHIGGKANSCFPNISAHHHKFQLSYSPQRNKEELNILFEYAGKSVRSRDILYLKASSPFVKIYFLSGNNIPERSA